VEQGEQGALRLLVRLVLPEVVVLITLQAELVLVALQETAMWVGAAAAWVAEVLPHLFKLAELP